MLFTNIFKEVDYSSKVMILMNNQGQMSDKDEIITLYDEENNQTDYVIVDGVEYEGKMYLALVEAEHADDDECEFIILRADNENDEDVLTSIEDEKEFDAVMQLFSEKFDDDDEYEIEEDEEDIEE